MSITPVHLLYNTVAGFTKYLVQLVYAKFFNFSSWVFDDIEIVARKSFHRPSLRPHNRTHHVYGLHGRIFHERFGLLSPFPRARLICSSSLLEYNVIDINYAW